MLAFLLRRPAESIVVLAVTVGAVAIQVEAVVGQTDVVRLGDVALALFDHLVGELDHLPQSRQTRVVVVLPGWPASNTDSDPPSKW